MTQQLDETILQKNRGRDIILKNIDDFKSKFDNLQQSLQSQKAISTKKLEIEKLKHEKLIKKMQQSKQAFSSFNSIVSRQDFVSQISQIQFFDDKKEIYINNIEYFENKDKLIAPQRNYDYKTKQFSFQIQRPLIKLNSDFPPLSEHDMSQKELSRLDFWKTVTEKNEQIQKKNIRLDSEGSLKRKKLDEMQQSKRVFLPSRGKGDVFTKQPSLISENPQTYEEVLKQIQLPRIMEKKVWNH